MICIKADSDLKLWTPAFRFPTSEYQRQWGKHDHKERIWQEHVQIFSLFAGADSGGSESTPRKRSLCELQVGINKAKRVASNRQDA
jgi:hypothetical protein